MYQSLLPATESLKKTAISPKEDLQTCRITYLSDQGFLPLVVALGFVDIAPSHAEREIGCRDC